MKRAWAPWVALAPVLCPGGPAHAEVWRHEASVQADVTATDNGTAGTPQPKKADLLGFVKPDVRVSATGARLNLLVDAAAAFYDSAHGTVDTRVLPTVDAALGAVLVPNLVAVDATASVHQVEDNPLGARVTSTSPGNSRTASTVSVAPVLRWQFAPGWEALARHEESVSNNATRATSAGGEAGDLVGHRTRLRLSRDPLPFGAALDAQHEDSRSTGGAVQDELKLDVLRAEFTYALAPASLVLGGVVGHETASAAQLDESDRLYGLTLHWQPSPRTELAARVEHRFFGTGGRVDAQWRGRQASLRLELHREPLTATSGFGRGDAATQAAALLARRTLTPTPAAAASADGAPADTASAAVAPAGSGLRPTLSNSLPGSIDFSAGYAQLQSGGRASFALNGVRHAVTFELYRQTQRQLASGAPGLVPAAADTRQVGGSIAFERRLSTLLSLSLTGAASRVEGQGVQAGEVTNDAEVSLGLTDRLSPRTSLSGSLKYDKLRSNALGVVPSEATSLTVGMLHRF